MLWLYAEECVRGTALGLRFHRVLLHLQVQRRVHKASAQQHENKGPHSLAKRRLQFLRPRATFDVSALTRIFYDPP